MEESNAASRRPGRAVVLALLLALTIGAIDYFTSYELAVSAFYLPPILWACWAAGRKAGLLLAVLCALIWLGADLLTGHTYRHPLIPVWNALMLLLLFVTVVQLLSDLSVTQRKLSIALASLQQANEGLEETVRLRTAALQSEIAERKRLENAKLQAERLAMVGTIAAQVAHEVRNPLGSITLNLDLVATELKNLADGAPDQADEGCALVNEMRAEVQRIQRVIEDYLRLARLPKPQRKAIKLNLLVEEKLGFLAPAFEQADIRLREEFDPAIEDISGDPEQLWQAILNLVRNSMEATPRGGAISVSTRREGSEVLIRVVDTGKGMNQEQLRHLFEPFFTTKPKGTGLGLALTQQILNEHGARIECDSTVGRGTAFTIHFPLTASPHDY